MFSLRTLGRLALVFVWLAIPVAACSETERSSHWWRSVDREERLGYLAGYADCSIWEARQTKLAHVSWYTLEFLIGEFYAQHPQDSARSVASVALELGSKFPADSREKGGELHDGKHGIFDGEYWRQSQPSHRLGFVEGFGDCLRLEGIAQSRLAKPTAWYVAQLSEWFGIEAVEPGAIRADRASLKIADALFRFLEK